MYSLGRILHDWPEDRIRLLLSKIYAALPAGGALLIAEKLLDEDKSGPTPAQMQSLNMLVCTEGRERTLGRICEHCCARPVSPRWRAAARARRWMRSWQLRRDSGRFFAVVRRVDQ